MYILGTPEGPLNVTIISEVGKSALSFSHHPVIGLVNDVTIIPKPGHLPTPDNRQGKQRTSGSDQVIWQGDKLHYWQFMELKSSISFVFFLTATVSKFTQFQDMRNIEKPNLPSFSRCRTWIGPFSSSPSSSAAKRASHVDDSIERLGISRSDPCATSKHLKHPADSHEILLTSLGCAKMCQTCCEKEFMDAGQPFMRHDLEA